MTVKIECLGLFQTRMRVPAYKFKCPFCEKVSFGHFMIVHLEGKHGVNRKDAKEAILQAADSYVNLFKE